MEDLKEVTPGDRLRQVINLLKAEKLIKSSRDIERKLGIADKAVSDYVNGRRRLTSEFLSDLKTHFDRVNVVFLVTGEGDPLHPRYEMLDHNSLVMESPEAYTLKRVQQLERSLLDLAARVKRIESKI